MPIGVYQRTEKHLQQLVYARSFGGMKGKSHSAETRKKMSVSVKKAYLNHELREKMSIANKGKHNNPSGEFRKGHVGYKFWLGKKMSQEFCLKLSKAKKGKKLSPETKAKMSLSRKGKKRPPFSEEWKEKISKAKKGTKMSLETRKKLSKANSGSKSYLWKGGITPATEKIRKSISMKEWRHDIFRRDDYTCQKCGQKGGELHADHIIPFSFILSQLPIKNLYNKAMNYPPLWNIKNGRTVCLDCHKTTDTYLVGARYISKSTKQQWKEFLENLVKPPEVVQPEAVQQEVIV